MVKKIILLVGVLGSLSASADLGVGALVSTQRDWWKESTDQTAVRADSASSRYGVLVWVPFFPTLSFRSGYILEKQKLTATSLAGVQTDSSIENQVIPLNVQLSIVGTNLSVFGGALLVNNNSLEPNAGYKFLYDVRMNLGAAYEMMDLGLAALSVEVEHQRGTRSVSPNPDFDLKVNSLAANLVFKVGF